MEQRIKTCSSRDQHERVAQIPIRVAEAGNLQTWRNEIQELVQANNSKQENQAANADGDKDTTFPESGFERVAVDDDRLGHITSRKRPC